MTTPAASISIPRARRRRRITAVALAAPLALALAASCSSNNTASTAGSTPGSGAGTTKAGGTSTGTGGTGTTAGGSKGTTAGTAAPAGLSTLKITAAEAGDAYTFDIPKGIKTGWSKIELDNQGVLPHQVNIGRLQDGVTAEQVEGILKSEAPTNVAALVQTWVGGPNGVPAGEKGSGIVDFAEPGNYIALCFLSSPPDMKEHVTHGMYEMFEVTEGATSSAPEIEVAGEIELKDFTWLLPDDFTGKGTYKLVDTADQPHELAIYALADGATVEDVKAVLGGQAPAGPPPFTDAGGFGAISKGNDAYVDLDLKPGKYVLICFLPDAPPPERDLQPHFTHGMITEVTIK